MLSGHQAVRPSGGQAVKRQVVRRQNVWRKAVSRKAVG